MEVATDPVRLDNIRGRKRKRKEGRLLQACVLSQLLVRPPNTAMEGNRHVEDIRQFSGTEPEGGSVAQVGEGRELVKG